MTVYTKWHKWAEAHRVRGERYTRLYHRLSRSPAVVRLWRNLQR